MPNPVRPLKRSDRLTKRQKMTVRKLRRHGLPVKVYRRKGNRNRLSVHNPFLDSQRRADKAPRSYVKKYPHASDTGFQRTHITKPKKGKTVSKRARKVKSKTFLDKLFRP